MRLNKPVRASNMRGNISSLRLMLLASAVAFMPSQVFAQTDDQSDNSQDSASDEQSAEEIIVLGDIGRSIENSLATKRNLSVIGDAIVGDDIGDLPDLSVAETLERIVGVSADRFRGQSAEISIRGLGAFLGQSYINGRELTSGSDGRDINFTQFPSEIVNGAIVYKTQQASFIEGGVSGVIELQTLRPLDYGKSRIQVQGQVGYSDYEERVIDGQPFSTRFSASYVDQFDLGGLGELGISIGGQTRRDTAPEDAFFTSSTFRPCNTIEGVDSSNNCSFLTDADGNPSGASDTFFVSNQYIFRAVQSQRDLDAFIGAIQWKVSPNLEFNFDGQYSFRDDIEERSNLVIADGRRDITPIEISDSGALLAHTGESRIENQQVVFGREEEFIALGGNVKYTTGRFTISADIGYSKTERRQDEFDLRIRTNDRVIFQLDTRGVEVPVLTFLDVSDVEEDTGLAFDLNDHNIFTNGARARRRLENVDDEILALRLDGNYEFDGFLSSVDFGLRYADRQRIRDDGIDNNGISLLPGGYFSDAAIATRSTTFPVRNLFQGASTGGVTENLTFASFDALALFEAVTGSLDAGLPTGSTLSPEDTDVTEETFAGYVQANFDTQLFGLPATGNLGLRAVRTETTSIGIGADLQTMPDPTDPQAIIVTPTGEVTINTERNDYWSFLPSANVSLELENDLLLRLAAYRAIARPDQESLSAGLSFDNQADLADIGDIVSASGNPFLEPLESWNLDASLEWYASSTTSIFFAGYYKNLQTGIETDVSNLTINLDGVPTDLLIGRSVNSNDSSTLFGFEISVQHKFDYLPSPLDGFGVQFNYNFADSNFEFPDPTVVSGDALADFTTPANIPGFSRHTANANLYYEKGRISTRLAYRFRSEFFRPFRTSSNRFNDDQGFLDYSFSLNLFDGLQARFQVLNITDEPVIQNRPVNDSLAEASFGGTRYFIGLRGKF
jgi:TonB-dependent receptor